MGFIHYFLLFLKFFAFISISFFIFKITYFITSRIFKLFLFFRFMGFKVVGNPNIAWQYWSHQKGSSCAVNIQRIILEIFGIHKGENELVGRQQAYKLHDDRGSQSATFLINGYGINTEPFHGVEKPFKKKIFFELWQVLKKGKLAIGIVNAFTLNSPDRLFSSDIDPNINHSILITGLERGPNGDLFVWYADTGIKDGAIRKISGSDFLSAIAGGCYFVTDKVPSLENTLYASETAYLFFTAFIVIFIIYISLGWMWL